MKIAVFASGNGSNFEAIANQISAENNEAELVLLFCDRKQAFVIERSRQLGIPSYSFSPAEFTSKTEYEEAILALLQENQIELIVLAGYMRLIGTTLLMAYQQKILNIHPALLPDFPGLHGIRDAFEAQVSQTGVTIHLVDDGVDTGPIIAQEAVSLEVGETLESLERKIHQVEHRLYPIVIQQFIEELEMSKN